MTTQDQDTFVFETSLSAISGFLLSNIREQMGVNQREIARIFDMTHVTYGSMERGETAINTDFIYMLCTLVGIKFSDYFSLIDDIIFELENKDSCLVTDNIKINIIPSSEILKITSDPEYKEVEFSKDKKHNLIIGESFLFFLGSENKAKISDLSKIRLTKEQIKEMVNLKSDDIEIEQSNNVGTVQLGAGVLGFNTTTGLTTASVVAGAVVAGPVGWAGLAGFGLYKAYKKVKEDKKNKS
ncbi:helix-turn-helix transcriptional regulator [Acinetobacter baumannii]|uniref:helix-turn-helix domain-containing protein n=1 Tax=Acinetobacter baumannii TaxID=470 RepID=UPI002DB935D8|nr:helix-turn-helix transcriptional regulator [Acinetobacter baumannii]MEB6558781.1 helix-turn-helix domain-containing protein [Acinetobacter baumannii]